MNLTKRDLLLVPLLMAYSCIDASYDFNSTSVDVNLTPAVAAPVAESRLSILQLITNDSTGNPTVKADADNLLHVYYSQQLDSLPYDSFAQKMADQHQAVKLLPDRTTLPPNMLLKGSVPIPFALALTSPDQVIEQVTLSKGALSMALSKSFTTDNDALIAISSDDITMADGRHFYATFGTGASRVTADLRGATIAPSLKNTVAFTITYSFRKSGGTARYDYLNLSVDLTGVSASATTGYLGRVAFGLNQQRFPLSYGKKIFSSDDATIKSPDVRLEFLNTIGVPFVYRSHSIAASVKEVPFPIIGFPETTAIASGVSSSMKTATRSVATFDRSTNLITALSRFPEYLLFDGELVSNYEGSVVTNHIRSGDALVIRALMDLPLEVKLKNVRLVDTISYDLSDIAKNLDRIERLKVFLVISNGYPANFRLNAYLADSQLRIVDTLFAEPITVKSAVTSNGNATTAITSTAAEEFSNSRLTKVSNTRHIILNAVGTTSGAEEGLMVRIKGDSHLDVKVYGATKLKTKSQ